MMSVDFMADLKDALTRTWYVQLISLVLRSTALGICEVFCNFMINVFAASLNKVSEEGLLHMSLCDYEQSSSRRLCNVNPL
jgi:hypothetical protein